MTSLVTKETSAVKAILFRMHLGPGPQTLRFKRKHFFTLCLTFLRFSSQYTLRSCVYILSIFDYQGSMVFQTCTNYFHCGVMLHISREKSTGSASHQKCFNRSLLYMYRHVYSIKIKRLYIFWVYSIKPKRRYTRSNQSAGTLSGHYQTKHNKATQV